MAVSTVHSTWPRVIYFFFCPQEEPLTPDEHFLFAFSSLCRMQRHEECVAVHQNGAISYHEMECTYHLIPGMA